MPTADSSFARSPARSSPAVVRAMASSARSTFADCSWWARSLGHPCGPAGAITLRKPAVHHTSASSTSRAKTRSGPPAVSATGLKIAVAGAVSHSTASVGVDGRSARRCGRSMRRPQSCTTRPSPSRTGTTTLPRNCSWPVERSTPRLCRRARSCRPAARSGDGRVRPRVRSDHPTSNAAAVSKPTQRSSSQAAARGLSATARR